MAGAGSVHLPQILGHKFIFTQTIMLCYAERRWKMVLKCQPCDYTNLHGLSVDKEAFFRITILVRSTIDTGVTFKCDFESSILFTKNPFPSLKKVCCVWFGQCHICRQLGHLSSTWSLDRAQLQRRLGGCNCHGNCHSWCVVYHGSCARIFARELQAFLGLVFETYKMSISDHFLTKWPRQCQFVHFLH